MANLDYVANIKPVLRQRIVMSDHRESFHVAWCFGWRKQ